jgi:hypothetical protein
MKVNSIGSVTPVRNEVNPSTPAGRRFRVGARQGGVVHRQAGRGQAEHHHREETAHEGAGAGSPAKKRFRSPVTPP